MTYQARGPKVLKGAFVTIPVSGGSPSTVAFQYNPATLKRSLQPQLVGGEPQARSQAVRFTGPPVQTISIDIELDAADGMCSGNAAALASGSLPQLAQLELLVYPQLAAVKQAQAQLASGVMEIAAKTAPRTLFVWGAKRVLPVSLTGYQISEELFDNRLNPVQVTVSVTMRVLSYTDLDASSRASFDFMTYQQNLVELASSAGGSGQATGTGINAGSY
ncbi:hypothetical protein GCM10009127_13540 [Alteraurantiacibacter aestuarii]|uniref:Uncharacterized protein n=1 Tax=Alteraurantiacibacter aestuarii TaxID=650004 RepID=A0A844ZJT4_9SPHN|nr:hypothetical protein [Alteraurantiacibacter aestuarii]MXO88055.1 hypothetical protein [Alteraurantiacibacter aestuarii]